MSETNNILVEDFDVVGNDILVEATTKEKQYFIEGICIQSNIKNRNGRIYPKDLVRREVGRYVMEKLDRNQAVGELNHPKTDPSINYERVTHRYLWLKEDGDNWIGRAQVAHKTPMGSIVAGLMECGVVMGTSTRARGTTKLFEGVQVVQNDFRLITAGDIVSDPSAPEAFLTNLMEGKEWVWANGVLIEKEREIKSHVNKLARTRQLNEDSMKGLFNLVMSQIKGV